MAQDKEKKNKNGSTGKVYYVRWKEVDDTTGVVTEIYRYINYRQIDDFLEAHNVIKFFAVPKK